MSDPQQIEMPDPPYQREDYRVVWMAGWLACCRAARSADQAEIAQLTKERDALKAEKEWRPIETVPERGPVLLTDGRLRWLSGRYALMSEARGKATHWMPLPAPPEAQ